MVPSGPRNSWTFGNNDDLNIIKMMMIMMIVTMIMMMMITWAFGIRSS